MGPARHISLRLLSVLSGLVLIIVPSQNLAAQGRPAVPSDTVQVALSGTDSVVVLPNGFVLEGSERVLLDGTTRLTRGLEYEIDYRRGRIRLARVFLQNLPIRADTLRHSVTVLYDYLPFHLQDEYARRELTVRPDTLSRDTLQVARPVSSLRVEDLFGPNLQKSGSIFRGFTVGSNQDLSVNSGLRLQLSGKISPEIEVAAALTDESTPIQPEGTTQSLQEFDKVFVEIKSPNLGAVLGDFNLTLTEGEFASLSRKLQGAQGTGILRSGTTGASALVAGAVNRGKFNTNQFNGLEGVQGPYRLTGKNGETFITVIAGTERVYLDGQLQVRGETNEYVIDYSIGELTFTTQRLVTSASRITVDFEYADRSYSRAFLAGQAVSTFFDEKARLSVTYVREADDPESPLDFVLDDSARAALEQAGGDPSRAVLSGVAEVDSNGLYTRVDTILASGEPAQFYRYAPGDSGARYVVKFSFVGPGKGEYIRQSVGVFLWRGSGGGDYLPVRLIPLPQSNQIIDASLSVFPLEGLRVDGEYARSAFDANRVSGIDDTLSGGNAYSFGATYSPQKIRLGDVRLERLDISLRERFVDRHFVSIDRTREIEFNRKWGLDTLLQEEEEIREASLTLVPVEAFQIGGSYGSIHRGERVNSNRFDARASLQGEGLPTVSYYIERIRTENVSVDNDADWLRQKGLAEYTLGWLTPTFRYEAEKRTIQSLAGGAVLPGSFRFSDVSGGFRASPGGSFSAFAMLGVRIEDDYSAGAVTRESRAVTQNYGARLGSWNNLSTSLDLTLRNRDFTEAFEQQGRSDIASVLVRSQTRYTPLRRGIETDLLYQVSTEQSSRLQRVFVRVAPGSGQYRYLGDLNNNGIADEAEFVPVRFDGDYVAVTVPTDELLPVIDLNASVRFRLTPSRFLESGGWGGEILRALSSETYLRVDEKSTEEDLKKIYLLQCENFQQDSTTLNGSTLITQDLHLFEGKPDFSVRLRFNERRALNTLSGGVERSYGRERSVRLRWQFLREIAAELDLENRNDVVTSAQASSRLRDITGNDLRLDLSYRPEQNVQFGLALLLSNASDRYPAVPQDADINTQTLRWVLSFEGAGQLRLEGSREEVVLSGSAQVYAFELTRGRVPGKSWLWGAAFDYRITSFIQATASYDGRAEGGRPPVHSARAELRAFF
jgi:hypothetical protein